VSVIPFAGSRSSSRLQAASPTVLATRAQPVAFHDGEVEKGGRTCHTGESDREPHRERDGDGTTPPLRQPHKHTVETHREQISSRRDVAKSGWPLALRLTGWLLRFSLAH